MPPITMVPSPTSATCWLWRSLRMVERRSLCSRQSSRSYASPARQAGGSMSAPAPATTAPTPATPPPTARRCRGLHPQIRASSNGNADPRIDTRVMRSLQQRMCQAVSRDLGDGSERRLTEPLRRHDSAVVTKARARSRLGLRPLFRSDCADRSGARPLAHSRLCSDR
jgi:hypothetical protein